MCVIPPIVPSNLTHIQEILEGFQRAEDEDDWLFARKEPTPAGLSRLGGGMIVDTGVITRYVRDLNGQIQIKSELGKGTIYIVELHFKPVPASDNGRPRKLRDLFPSLSTPKVQPAQSIEPLVKAAKPRPTSTTMSTPPARKIESRCSEGSSVSHSPNIQILDSVRARPESNNQVGTYNTMKGETSSDMDNVGQNFPANLNVLIADSDPSSVRMLDERFSRWGHTVDIASEGQECYDHFASNPAKIDVIIVDLEACIAFLPEMIIRGE